MGDLLFWRSAHHMTENAPKEKTWVHFSGNTVPFERQAALLVPEKPFKFPDKRVVELISADQRIDAVAHIQLPGYKLPFFRGASVQNAQHVPNAVNESAFPSPVVKAGEKYTASLTAKEPSL